MLNDAATAVVHSLLTVGGLRRLLAGLDDNVPVGAIRLAASAGAAIGRVETASAVEVHVSFDGPRPTALWVWCRTGAVVTDTGRSELPLPAALAGTVPERVVLTRACGCLVTAAIEEGLVHLDAGGCVHQPARSRQQYERLVATRILARRRADGNR